MASSRLSTALDNGVISLPDSGRIALLRARADHELSALPQDRIEAIQGFYPDYAALAARGVNVGVAPEGDYSAALVFLPRAKAEARALIAQAKAICADGPVIVDGQKTDGIDSMLKECRRADAVIREVFSKAHGKIFSMSGGNFTAWGAQGHKSIGGGYVTAPGVFSADAIDRGSAALVAALPARLSGRVCDLGAGWGYLAREMLGAHPEITECHLVEAEHSALECARENVPDPRARFHWDDAGSFEVASAFDHVVTNPPFHVSRAADASIGRGFISAAARLMARHGTLWLVANRHLPYERDLSAAFGEVQEIAGDAAFKIYRARKPVALKPRSGAG